MAQLVPDSTLGTDNSEVIPLGGQSFQIEGGAKSGSNLFHSFESFSIETGQGVYFANPVAIENILTRVTGGNISDIDGTLGVLGNANLFLLNPNGVVFGPNARLDIAGSFHVTTTEDIALGDAVFSAIAPAQSQLLSVSPDVLFLNRLNQDSGDVIHRGQLVAGGDLTLAARNLDLHGQVAAASDVSLLAVDTVQIRDTAEAPFVALAGGELLVQGNEQVDILALSHPESGLFSYGDMVLRSPTPVGGDAHYWSRGNFRVEQLDGSAGQLYSPIDPIIRAFGNVEFEGYIGSSLHILAGVLSCLEQ